MTAGTSPDSSPGAEALSVERMRVLIRHLPAAVLVEDEERRILLANQRFCDLFGIEVAPEALVGVDCSNAAETSSWRFADPVGFVRRVADIVARREVVQGERLEMADGRTLVRDYAPVSLGARFAGHMWTYRDITAEVAQAAEVERVRAFYQRVLDGLPAQLAVFGPDCAYQYVTPSAVRDPDTRAWLVGRTDRDYGERRGFPVSVIDTREAMLRHAVETGEEVRFEECLLDREGQERHIRRFLAPVLDPNGRVQHLLGYGLDITDLKRVEAELRTAKGEAEAFARARERFLATMSHELRTPLNAVVGTAFLLGDTSLDAQQARLVTGLRAGAEALLALVNDVLDLAKMGAGALRFERIPLSLSRVVQGVMDSMRPGAEGRGLALTCAIDPTIPAEVLGDPTRLTQVLVNLVGNAIKFTARGEVHVSVRALPGEGDDVSLEFAVRDTGIGIARAEQDAIFHAFTQATDDTTRRYGGSGLGLSIVRELVTRQGGTVSVDSAPGLGSTFTVRLVFGRVEGASSVAADVAPADDLTGIQVLLVEDNEVNQFVMSRLLTRVGAGVDVCASGAEALERLRAGYRPDVVLMDLHLPQLDGFEATRRIREDLLLGEAELPIVALTASVVSEQRDRARAAGMNDFVMKPVAPSELYRCIVRWARRAAASAPSGLQRSVEPSLLLALAGGEPAFARQLVTIYLSHAPGHWQAVEDAWRSGDRGALGNAAHKMRSAAAVMGARPLASLLETLEAAAGRASPPELQDLVERTRREADLVIADLGRIAAGDLPA